MSLKLKRDNELLEAESKKLFRSEMLRDGPEGSLKLSTSTQAKYYAYSNIFTKYYAYLSTYAENWI